MDGNVDIAIRVQGVSKTFGDAEILHEVWRDFEERKIHGIVGNNGSGKTVLMKCICGFLPPTTGRVLVRGRQVGRDMDFPDDTGLRRRIDKEAIRENILRVGLDPDMKKPVGKYSLGMRQRLGIAQAIMENPSILILDEPLNGLDKNGAAHMRRLIKELRERGKTVLLASHDPMDIDELCDTVCEMDAGVMTEVK